MIPKVIHYCWFGRNPKPEVVQTCIESWKKYCPDYRIIEWNEDNFDVNALPYTQAAYADRKWAFVSDYARLRVIFEEGGCIWTQMYCFIRTWINCSAMTAFWHPMM